MGLSNLGRREHALKATDQALELYRRLAADNPAAFEPDLASALNNLSVDLSNLGRGEQALHASDEAVKLYRSLVAASPAAFEPDLASALNNLSVHLSDLGRREPALQATQEAVELYRRLAGFPLLLIAPGSMNSSIEWWARAALNPLEVYRDDFQLVAMDQRNAGVSTGSARRRGPLGILRGRPTPAPGPPRHRPLPLATRELAQALPYRSPRRNSFAERWVGTARREALDDLLIFGCHHLKHVLREFVEHYEEARPHQGLGQRTPRHREPIAASAVGPVQRRDRLGGVLHEYVRQAA
jgi:tetratricopeptide (TPR) repeat protein